MKLKICGMKYQKNITEVAQLLPDYMGFIFYDKSPRYFEGAMPKIPETVQKVGVFVDGNLDELLDKIRKYNLQLVQLHGNESPEYCQLAQCLNVKIIKVFSVDDSFDFGVISAYENVCDYFLFDTKGEKPGGNGQRFNWQILENYTSKKPLFLSGGIGLSEIQKIKVMNLPIYAIDINSRFEIQPGFKNLELLNNIQL